MKARRSTSPLVDEWVDKAEGDFDTMLRESKVGKYREDLAVLSAHAVECRYPGEVIGKEDARDARTGCERFRLAARRVLGFERSLL